MGKRFNKGDKVYIIESMGKKSLCEVVSSSGGFTVVRLPSGGAIRLRDSRIHLPEEFEEKSDIPEVKSPLADRGYKSPYDRADPKSKYGI